MSFRGRLTGRPKPDSNTGHGSGAGVSFGLQPTWNVVGRRKLLASEPQTERITTLHHSTWVSADDSDTAVLHDCIVICVVSYLFWILVHLRTVYCLLLLCCHFPKNNFCWVMKHIGTVVSKFRFLCNFIPTVRNTIKEVDECQGSGAYCRIAEKKSIFILLFMVVTEILCFRCQLP